MTGGHRGLRMEIAKPASASPIHGTLPGKAEGFGVRVARHRFGSVVDFGKTTYKNEERRDWMAEVPSPLCETL